MISTYKIIKKGIIHLCRRRYRRKHYVSIRVQLINMQQAFIYSTNMVTNKLKTLAQPNRVLAICTFIPLTTVYLFILYFFPYFDICSMPSKWIENAAIYQSIIPSIINLFYCIHFLLIAFIPGKSEFQNDHLGFVHFCE